MRPTRVSDKCAIDHALNPIGMCNINVNTVLADRGVIARIFTLVTAVLGSALSCVTKNENTSVGCSKLERVTVQKNVMYWLFA